MPDLLDIRFARRSVRDFLPGPVAPAQLETVLRAAQAAPSAGNLQSYAIVVVSSESSRRALARAALDQECVARASHVLVFLQDLQRASSHYGRRGRELYSVQDATIACCHAHLAAAALGLGSCWIGAFHPEQVRDVVRAPDDMPPIAMLALGHPASRPEDPGRRPSSEIVRLERF